MSATSPMREGHFATISTQCPSSCSFGVVDLIATSNLGCISGSSNILAQVLIGRIGLLSRARQGCSHAWAFPRVD